MKPFSAACVAILAVGTAALSTATHAQLANGYSGFSGAPRDGTLDEFYWTLAEMGRCLAQNRKAESVALTASQAGSKAEASALKEMFGRPSMCVRGASTIAAPTHMIRGAIAEALYEKAKRPPPAALAAFTPLTLNKADRATARMDRAMDDFAACLATAQPQAVHGLLAGTKLGSKAEDAEIGRLSSAFNQCLVTDGAVRFRASELRLSLAEALYRRVVPISPTTSRAD